MEVAIGFGIAGGLVVVGLLIWWIVSVLRPRPPAPSSILLVGTPQETASTIGRRYANNSRGASPANTGRLGYRQFPGRAFTSGPGGATTMVFLKSKQDRRSSTKARKARKVRKQ